MRCWQASKTSKGCTIVDKPFVSKEACIISAEETFGEGYVIKHITLDEARKHPDFKG